VARFQAAKQARFSPQKKLIWQFQRKVVLIDRLAHLMIEHGIGTTRVFSDCGENGGT